VKDLRTMDATLGESGELVLLALMDGAKTPGEIGAITGMANRLISARLRVMVNLKLAVVQADEYNLTEQGLELARIVAERRNL